MKTTSTPDLSACFKAYDIRGIVPTTLNEDIIRAIGAAYADVIGAPTVVIGGDMRPSSPNFARAFAAGITRRGANAILLGEVSTDELYFASGHLGHAGVMFTASHNPAEYNGMKMTRAHAVPISTDTGLREIQHRAEQYLREPIPAAPQQGSLSEQDVLEGYASYLRGLVDLTAIRPLTVVVDAGNGMAGLTTPAVLGDQLLGALPLRILPLYFELDGTFPNHEANPLDPKNLRDLQAAVVDHGADLGLAFDGDADRCFVIDERGEPVSPSAITALVAAREIARAQAAGETSPVIVHNLITSRAVPETVARLGGRPVRTRVGHSFIKAVMAKENAVFGGEHSAHYYFRDFYFADTGMLAALHVLAALGTQPKPLSHLVAQYSPYAASGEINSDVRDGPAAVDRVRAVYERPGVSVEELDGVTFTDEAGHWWFNLRPSQTEPLLRFNAEAQDSATLEDLRERVLGLIRPGEHPQQ